MEESSEPKGEPIIQETEVDVSKLVEAAAAFSVSVTSFNKVAYVDMRQKGGRWAPAFPETSLKRQEEYVIRMIRKDKQYDLG